MRTPCGLCRSGFNWRGIATRSPAYPVGDLELNVYIVTDWARLNQSCFIYYNSCQQVTAMSKSRTAAHTSMRELIVSRFSELTPAERKVGRVILDVYPTAGLQSVAELRQSA